MAPMFSDKSDVDFGSATTAFRDSGAGILRETTSESGDRWLEMGAETTWPCGARSCGARALEMGDETTPTWRFEAGT
jgi:hypothetical protein